MTKEVVRVKDRAFTKEFALRLKQCRANIGCNQRTVAEFCNITTPSYSNWEQGRVLPPISIIPSLAEFFHVDANYLLGTAKHSGNIAVANQMEFLSKDMRNAVSIIIDRLSKNPRKHRNKVVS